MKERLTASGFRRLRWPSPIAGGCHASHRDRRPPMRPPSAVRQAPDPDGRWRIRATEVLSAGLRQPWSDRLRRSRSLGEVGNCIHVGIPWQRAASARFGHAQAIIRCGEAVQFQWWGSILSRNRAERPLLRGDGRFGIAGWWRNAPDLPDVSTCFRSIHAGRRLLCMGLLGARMVAVPTTNRKTDRENCSI